MRFAGQFSQVPANFLISKAAHLGKYPVEFHLARGAPAQHEVERGIGKFLYHGDVARGLISAWYCVPDAAFTELWHRFSGLGRDEVQVGLTIGPIERSFADEIIWDRSRQKFLFITEAEITFRKDLATAVPLDRPG
jgi:hypothetical protein